MAKKVYRDGFGKKVNPTANKIAMIFIAICIFAIIMWIAKNPGVLKV